MFSRVSLNAEFIWSKDERKPNTYFLFRREIKIINENDYIFRISACSRYRLYIDGDFMGDGPPSSPEYVSICDIRRIKLSMGIHCIAVEVWDIENGSQPFLIAELLDNDSETLISTDESWPVFRAPMWKQDTLYDWANAGIPYQEHYDAGKVPENWMLPGYKDDNWPRAAVREPTPLVKRDIPFIPVIPVYAEKIELIEEALGLQNRMRSQDLSISLSMKGKQHEYTIIENSENLLKEHGTSRFGSSTKHNNHDFSMDGYYDPCIILDFQKIITGYIEFCMDGIKNGILDVGYAERLIDGHFVNSLEGLHGSDRYIMKGGKETYRFFTWKAFRYIKLRFRDCFNPVTVYYNIFELIGLS